MRRCSQFVFVLGLALAVAAWPSLATDVRSREVLREKVKTIAVMPMIVPDSVPNAEQVELRLEKGLEERLAAAGFNVTPASTMRELRDKIRVALGGYYDPRTGDVDKQRLETWETHVNSEFRRLHPADAWLYSRITVLRAAVQGSGLAVWHGVAESTIGEESRLKQIFASPEVTGSLAALSLQVLLATPNGDDLYSMSAGLQLLEYLDTSGGGTGYVPVADDSIMTDPLREQRALAMVLDPMVLTPEQRKTATTANEAAWEKIKPVPKGHRPGKVPQVDRATFLARFPRIAVAMPEIPETTNRAAARDRLATALQDGLQKAGFAVVPPSDYAAVWDPIYSASGGFYDPMTGKLLTEKRNAAIREAFEKLGANAPVDAVFLPQVVLRPARIEKGEARWDGAEVPLSGGKVSGFFTGSFAFGGTVPALSLELHAVDRDLNEVFLGRGGIELLVRFKGGNLLAAGSFEDIPEADWLAKPGNEEKAVRRALAALMPSEEMAR